jgi:hypothetical protein
MIILPESPPQYPPLITRRTFPLNEPTTTIVSILEAPVPKPKGEVSRLKRGGYNLKAVLGWKESLYNEVMVHT